MKQNISELDEIDMNNVNSENIVIVILAGGIGTRFWPVSTPEKPKQFLKLFGDDSLLQLSRERVRPLAPPDRVLVLTNQEFVPLVREQLPDIPAENIVGEPCRRDTAAAVALSAYLARKRFGNPVIVTVTADHIIEPAQVFRDTIRSAARSASSSDALYTIGIRPAGPSISYGYLERGEQIADDNGIKHFRLTRFHEKPDITTAEQYLATGHYYWNSGMFVWNTGAIIRELELRLPDHAALLSKAATHDCTTEWEPVLERAFNTIKPVSIDYGVMEHALDVRCVEAAFDWSDVGGWKAVKESYPSDEHGNRGRGHLLTRDARSNFIFCEDAAESVAFIGVDDLVVVRAGNRTLVASKDRADEIKKLLANSPPQN